MGIHDFMKVIARRCKHVVKTIHISELSGITVAIDISIFLYKWIRASGVDDWLNPMLSMLINLKKYGIISYVIFDGPNHPPEKKGEHEKRKADYERQVARLQECKRMYDLLLKSFQYSIIDDATEKELRLILKDYKVDYKNTMDIVRVLRDLIATYTRQTIPISSDPTFSATLKEALDHLGIHYVQAEGEAEQLCSHLCLHGLVDAVFSRDTDVLVYLATDDIATREVTPTLLTEYELSTNTVQMIDVRAVLEGLELKPSQFRDMCIMLECDYNERVKGWGEKRCYDLITEHGCLENIEEALMCDVRCLKYQRCREIFTYPLNVKPLWKKLRKPKEFNVERVRQFLDDHNVKLKLELIKKAFGPPTIIFG
jgi:5'-3' exonuclease